ERHDPNRGGQPPARAPRAYPRTLKIFRPSAPSCEQNSGARRAGFHVLSGPSGLVFVGGPKYGRSLGRRSTIEADVILVSGSRDGVGLRRWIESPIGSRRSWSRFRASALPRFRASALPRSLCSLSALDRRPAMLSQSCKPCSSTRGGQRR